MLPTGHVADAATRQSRGFCHFDRRRLQCPPVCCRLLQAHRRRDRVSGDVFFSIRCNYMLCARSTTVTVVCLFLYQKLEVTLHALFGVSAFT